jgi:phage baseplate assembly protein W
MPLERVSQGFKDISMGFFRNPVNDDLIALKNENAIARSVRNIVFTERGEKVFDPIFGSRVSRILFENMDPVNAIAIKDEITLSINRYEPRVELINVKVIPDYDNHNYDVTISYRIIGADIDPQSLQFVLLPTR